MAPHPTAFPDGRHRSHLPSVGLKNASLRDVMTRKKCRREWTPSNRSYLSRNRLIFKTYRTATFSIRGTWSRPWTYGCLRSANWSSNFSYSCPSKSSLLLRR